MITGLAVEGTAAVERRFDGLSHAASDLTPVFKDIGPMFARRQDAVFASGGLGRWAPEAVSTMRTNQSPLVDTGVMREGLTLAHAIWSTKQAASFGALKSDRRVMNVAVLNAVGHQSRGASRVPPRVPVPPLKAAEKRDWLRLVSEHLMDGTNP